MISQFERDVAKESGIDVELFEKLKIFETMGAILTAGEDISLAGFGNFKVKTRKARKGRNPRTGATVDIAAKKVITFKAAKQFKEEVNEP